MRPRSKFFVVNIVLGIIFVITLLVGIFLGIVFKQVIDELEKDAQEGLLDLDLGDGSDHLENAYGEDVLYSIIQIEELEAVLLGQEYQGQKAQEGYQFYGIDIRMKNVGTQCEKFDILPLYCNGETYGDVNVLHGYDSDSDSAFTYSDYEMIPSGMEGTMRLVIEAKKGLSSVTVEYDPDYDSSRAEYYEVALP